MERFRHRVSARTTLARSLDTWLLLSESLTR